MRKTRTAALFAVLVLLGAVSYKAAYAVSSRKPAADYSQSDGSVPVHAFIYADHTVLELDSYSTALSVNDDSGGHIGFTRDGRYARLEGKLNHFTAYIDGSPVVFTRKGWTTPRLIQVDLKVPDAVKNDSDNKPVTAASEPAAAKPAAASMPVISASTPVSASAPLVLSPNETLVAPLAHEHGASTVAAPATASASSPAVSDALKARSTQAAQPSVLALQVAPTPNQTPAIVPVAKQAERIVPIERQLSLHISPSDSNLRTLLTGWAASVGWQVSWDVPKDVQIDGDATYHGTFEQILTQLLTDMRGSETSLAACVYDNNMARVVTSTVDCDRRKE